MPTVGRDPLASFDAGLLGRTLLDAAGSAGIGVTVTYVDAPTPQNVYVSPAAAAILGWSVGELMARSALDFVAPRDRARILDRWGRRHGGEVGIHREELAIVREDGREVFVDMTTTEATLDGRAAVFAFLFDATARREAAEQRSRAEAHFRELLEIAPEYVSIVRDGRFVYANRAYWEGLGYGSLDEMRAVPLGAMVDAEDAATQRAREDDLLARRLPVAAHTYSARRKDGSRILLEVNSVTFEYEGKPSVLTMARDVTQRRQLEHQLMQADRLAALGTLAAGVAHEINNPLAYLMLNLEWIARKLPGVIDDPTSLPGLTVMLEEARQGASRVSGIVRELRSFARADGETRRPVDLATVVQSAIRIVGHEIRHRANVFTSFEPTRPVLANESRLEQVVLNLLLNAAQAMPEERAANNEIRVAIRQDGERRAILEVADNGPGIPTDVLPRVFDPFFTTKPVGLGTGLGLSICHGIVASLGGKIAAYSAPGEGATFRVVLPTTETLARDSAAPSTDAAPSREAVRARVLVIDDEPAIASTLRELLAPEHQVSSATTAAEALAKLEREAFDVVFCDLMMPGTSGIELYEQIRRTRRGLESRIVFMTGGAFTARAAEFLASVPNRRIEKPFSLGLVEGIVRDLAHAASNVARAT